MNLRLTQIHLKVWRIDKQKQKSKYDYSTICVIQSFSSSFPSFNLAQLVTENASFIQSCGWLGFGLLLPFNDQIANARKISTLQTLQLLDNKYLRQPCFLHQLVSVVGEEWSSVRQKRSSNQTVSYKVTNVLLQNLQTFRKEIK